MGTVASQFTSLTIVYTTVYSDADQSKHQSSASLAFVWGIHRGPVNSPHKWPVTRKMFPFDDVIMNTRNFISEAVWSLTTKSSEACSYMIALIFDKCVGSIGAEAPVKFQSDTITFKHNFAASRLQEIVWILIPLSELRPWAMSSTWLARASLMTSIRSALK